MFEIAVQGALFQALNNSNVKSAVKGIYDAVPEFPKGCDQGFPYLTIGEAIHNEWDTDDTLGNNVSIDVHVWSRYGKKYRGRKEAKEIQGLIYKALHRQELTYETYDIISVDFENSQTFKDADGLTVHGVSTFRILIDEV